MKKLQHVFTLLLFVTSISLYAQDNNSLDAKSAILDKLKGEKGEIDKKIAATEAEIAAMKPVIKWKYGGFAALNVNQAAFVNWAPGGVNSIAGTAIGNLFANYKHKKISWNNTLDATWGLLYANKRLRKNDDRFEINSKFGYALRKNIDVAILGSFLTQFSPTYDYSSNNGIYPLKSYFAAPAWLNLSLGIDYKPTSYFSLYISPAAGKFTFVRKDSLIDETAYGLQLDKTYRAEFGALVRATLKKDIVKNVSLWTQLDLFNNYTDNSKDFFGKSNRGNIDVNWQVRVDMKINKFLSANIYTQLIYDHDQKVNVRDKDAAGNYITYTDVNGKTVYQTTAKNSRTQFREALGVGISYKFTSK
jgi:hypothetical protein